MVPDGAHAPHRNCHFRPVASRTRKAPGVPYVASTDRRRPRPESEGPLRADTEPGRCERLRCGERLNPSAPPTLDELVSEPARALALSADAALDLLARWSAVAPILIAAAARRGADGVTDVDVDARAAARLLGISPASFYKRLAGYPFVHREGRKILCSLAGIERYRREARGA